MDVEKGSHFIGTYVGKEVKMAKHPNMLEDLKSCYSENEEYASVIDHLSLNQKSFYDTSYGPLHKNCVDKPVSLNTYENSEESNFTFEDNSEVVLTSAHGKVLKKRRLSLNQTFSNEDLEAMANDSEEGIIEPRSAHYNFQSNVKFKFARPLKKEFTLKDSIHQSLIRDSTGQHLKALALNNQRLEVKFDMDTYVSSSANRIRPVTIRISNTQLFLCAQEEGQPVLLKEMPEIPRVITGNDVNLVFFWEIQRNYNFFRSAANSELFIATKLNGLVHMAKTLPSMMDFQIS